MEKLNFLLSLYNLAFQCMDVQNSTMTLIIMHTQIQNTTINVMIKYNNITNTCDDTKLMILKATYDTISEGSIFHSLIVRGKNEFRNCDEWPGSYVPKLPWMPCLVTYIIMCSLTGRN